MTPSEVLSQAADYIEEHGWTQGEYQDVEGRVCVMGAIDIATKDLDSNDMSYWLTIKEAEHRLRRFARNVSLVLWNDQEGRTQEQVVDALRKAAAL